MQANYVQRLRFVFGKDGATRYIGHLDLARTLERTLNRARIPLAYTQGYNPRPRLQLAAALPLGFTSSCEIADIWLLEKVDPDEVLKGIQTKAAPGIQIHRIEDVDIRGPALQTLVMEAEYHVSFSYEVDNRELEPKIISLMSSSELIRVRRGKEYDLRPLIIALKSTHDEQGSAQLDMKLTHLPAKTGRPDEVIAAMDMDPYEARIHRTQLLLKDAD